MKVIYKMENLINGKCYIGQTNNFKKRMNAHKSDSNNPKSHSYKTPLSNAIRKYGWNNFKNTIIEEIPDGENYKFVDAREKFFIEYYNSLTTKNGYNIATGGQGCPKPKLSYEEKLQLSKIFTTKDIKDIQYRMRKGEKRNHIMKLYPQLTPSYFDNINLGLNFKNNNWNYPLHNYSQDLSKINDIKIIHQIKNDIIKGLKYKDIANKWELSPSMISLINNGKQWYEEEYTYPLCYKNQSRVHAANTWVKDVQQDLLHSQLNLKEIANKYDKSYSTIKKINSGSSHRKKNYKYPLTSNRT